MRLNACESGFWEFFAFFHGLLALPRTAATFRYSTPSGRLLRWWLPGSWQWRSTARVGEVWAINAVLQVFLNVVFNTLFGECFGYDGDVSIVSTTEQKTIQKANPSPA